MGSLSGQETLQQPEREELSCDCHAKELAGFTTVCLPQWLEWMAAHGGLLLAADFPLPGSVRDPIVTTIAA
jgi:hypothetical protein